MIGDTGEYDDNGKKVIIMPGDVTVCYDGERHDVKKTGDEPLLIDAIVIKS